MAQVRNKVLGEYTYPSDFSEIPDGGLANGTNINVDRPSIAEPRRGFNWYKQISAVGTDRGNSLMSYRDTLYAHFGTTLAKDGTDPFTALSGTYDAPSFNGTYVPKIKGVEANRNFYFITNKGIKKLTDTSATPTDAGLARALDLQLSLGSTGTGFMSDDTQVAYRLVWAREDANDNLILGAPSGRYVIANTGGTSEDVSITASIPDGITTSDTYRIYRSGQSLNANIEPNDELQLVIEDNPTSAQISAKSLTVTDRTPDDLRGETIYTAQSQEGIENANDTPPAGKDITTFQNMAFVSNTIQKESISITLLAVGGTSGINQYTKTGDITLGSPIVINIVSTTGLVAGMRVTGAGVNSRILTVDSATQITMTTNASATTVGVSLAFFDSIAVGSVEYKAAGTENIANAQFAIVTTGTPAQNIADTAQSLIRVINRHTSNTTVYAYYQSGFGDLPGRIFLENRVVGAAFFSVVTAGHTTAWTPNMLVGAVSSAEAKRNRLHVSKTQRYEAFPRAQYFDIGAADEEILRIIPLREVCIICKTDGFWRVVGDTPSSLSIEPIDLTVSLIAPESARPLANTIYALTTQGFASINDTGVGVISRSIENQVTKLFAFLNINISFAIAYETDRSYLCWVPETASDTAPSVVHRYNVFTKQWTKHEKAALAAIVNPADDKIYYCDDGSNYVFKERKDRDYTDYTDEDIAVTISTIDGTTITLNAAYADIEVGDALTQGSVPYVVIRAVSLNGSGNTVLTLDYAGEFTAAAAVVKRSYECTVAFSPQFCGDPGFAKHVRECQAMFKRSDFSIGKLKFSSDIISDTEDVVLEGDEIEFWGYPPWGEFPWGGPESEPSKERMLIPAKHQINSWLNTSFILKEAFGYFEFAGMEYTFEPTSERTQK